MKKTFVNRLSVMILFCIAFSSCKKEGVPEVMSAIETNSDILGRMNNVVTAEKSVFATGLNNPRQLKFGPDGNLYVAEAGVGGTLSTVGICQQAGPRFVPYTGSTTGGRVSMINAAGERTTVTNLLPTSNSGRDILGPNDVAFIGTTMYVLLAGAGCSHGVPTIPNGIVRVNPDGTPTVIADLGAWQAANPAAEIEPFDFEPDGVWYNMIALGNSFYAVEPNHGDFVKVGLDGSIERIVDLSAVKGHIVPTSLAYKGNFYVANLGRFPISGTSSIFKITPSGNVKEVATGFHATLGLVIDQQNRMYVLEMTAGAPFPTPGLGRIIVVYPNGDKEVLVTGLSFPTGMTMGPDGNLYVSQWGFGRPPGGGEIVKVTLSN